MRLPLPSFFFINMMTTDFSSAELRALTFPARFESLDHVRNFVGRAAEECGLNTGAIYAVQLAVDEACSNIIEHAFGGECSEDIQCVCEMGSTSLTVTLRDCGKPFDPSQVPDPDLDAKLEDRSEGGLGLYFMRQLMDDVSFTFIPDVGGEEGCNILKMVKVKEPSE